MSINSKHFNKKYYLNICLGSEEFKKSHGKLLNHQVRKILDTIQLKPSAEVLEIGCGRGDIALHLAKKIKSIIAVDYSNEAIKIANETKKNFPDKIKEKVNFKVMSADKLEFKDNSFDTVIMIDTLDHLSKKEIDRSLKEISRVLKRDGTFFVKTCSNKFFLDYTYKYYLYPLNILLTYLDKKIKQVDYPSLPQDPRNKEQKLQHINEPSYRYLKKIFNKFNLKGKIYSEIGGRTEVRGIRSKVYNFITTLYPLSTVFPLNTYFGVYFYANLRNKKLTS